MKRYYITDRRGVGGVDALVECIARNLISGIDMIQLREKDLDGAALASLLSRVRSLPNPHGTRILANERLDIALACGADGVHLPSDSLPVERIRTVTPKGFLIGVSTHTEEEAITAEQGGADFVVFGPVFVPLSKASLLKPRGIGGLSRICSRIGIPVFALGGITAENAESCVRAGATGIAGITMFQGADSGR